MRHLILFLLLFSASISFSQDWKLVVTSKAEKNDKPLEGAVITVYKSGKQIDQKTTGADGKFKVELEANGDYKVEITKPGNVVKFFVFSTRGVPPEEGKEGFEFVIRAVELFEPPSDCDLGFLKQPLMKVAYDQTNKIFDYDKAAVDMAQQALANVADCIAEEKKKSKLFEKAMADGAAAMGKKDCKTATKHYTSATTIKPKNEEAKVKLKEAVDYCEKGDQVEKDYKAAMDAGNAAIASKDYTGALTNFEKAKTIKPSEPEPPKKIAEVNKLIEDDKKNKEFNDVLAAANQSMGAKDYTKAIEQFTKAKGMRPDHPEPPKKLEEIKKIMESEGKNKSFDDAMKAGNDAIAAKDYPKAIAEFTKAKGIKPENPEPPKKIEEVNKLMGDAAKEKQFQDAMKAGDDAKTAKDYAKAIAEYTKAKGIRPESPEPPKKIEEVNKLMGDAAKDKQFNDAMAAGAAAFTAKDYKKALDEYGKAKSLKPEAPEPPKKIDEINKLVGDLEKDKQFADAMKAGTDAVTAKDYPKAITEFTKAKGIKPENPEPPKKIEEVNKLMGDAAKDKQFNDAMTAGAAAFAAKDYKKAIDEYSKAKGLKPEAPEPPKKIEEINKLMGDAEKEKQFNDAMTAGNNAVAAKDYTKALAEYNKAKGIRPENPEPPKKIDEVNKLLGAAEQEKKFNEAMTAGNTAAAAKDYTKAIAEYTKAKDIKPAAPEPPKKIEEMNKLMGDAEKDKQFTAAMAAGATALAAKDYKKAIDEYTKAKGIKPDAPEPPKKIEEVNKLMGDVEKDKQFTEAMKAGTDAVTAKDYTKAIAEFNKAKSIKPENPEPPKKIEEVNKLLGEAEKDKQFADAMKAGADAVTAKDYTKALEEFNKAKGIKPASPEPPKKIDEVNKLIGAMNKDKEFTDAMKLGDDALAAKDYQKALAEYTKAKGIKPENPEPPKKIADVNKLLGDATKEKQFTDAMKAGDDAFAAKDYPKALAEYGKAKGIKPENPEPPKKIEEVNKLLGDAQKEKLFTDAMKAGDDAVAAKDFKKALAEYTKAKGIKADHPEPPKKIDEVNRLIADADAEKAFTDAMKAGADAMAAKNYTKALADYNKAKGLKPDHPEPPKKIEELNKLLGDSEIEKQFQEAMTAGKTSMGAKDFTKALESFNKAKGLRPENPEPQKKIDEINKLMGDVEKDKQFLAAMTAGDAAKLAKEYTKAIEQYTAAQNIKPDSKEPPVKITEVNKLIAALSASETAFNTALEEGKAAYAAKDWQKSLTAYKKAQSIKPEHPEPPKVIPELEKFIASAKLQEEARKQLELDYQKLMTEGLAMFTKKDYAKSLDKYIAAKDIGKDIGKEEEPQKKIDEINTILANEKNAQASAQELEKNFLAALKEGDDFKTAKEYDKAIERYTHAGGLKPKAPEPPVKIAEVKKLQKETEDAKLKEQQYEAAMKEGDDAEEKSQWDPAIAAFKKALVIKPGDADATRELQNAEAAKKNKDLADKLSKDKLEIEERFKKEMSEAKIAFTANDLKKALGHYTTANQIKKDEPEPPVKIEELKKLIAQQEEEDKLKGDKLKLRTEFDKAMVEGNKAVAELKYELALERFKHAQKLIPEEKEPPIEIKEVEDLIAKQKASADATKAAAEIEAKYKEAMRIGQEGITKKDWNGAKKKYDEALTYKPKDPEAIKKLEYIKQQVDLENINKKEAEYKAAVNRGNNDVKLKKYKEALSAFKEALGYKPGDAYATQKITELEKLVKPEDIAVTQPKKRSPYLDKYGGPGTFEETESKPGCHITKRIVIKGEDVKVYEQRHYNWGVTQFYRDGVEITQSVFELETK
jgi:tetratricopeptide (TPR) repeat protein